MSISVTRKPRRTNITPRRFTALNPGNGTKRLLTIFITPPPIKKKAYATRAHQKNPRLAHSTYKVNNFPQISTQPHPQLKQKKQAKPPKKFSNSAWFFVKIGGKWWGFFKKKINFACYFRWQFALHRGNYHYPTFEENATLIEHNCLPTYHNTLIL